MSYLKSIHYKLTSGIVLTGNETIVIGVLGFVIFALITWALISIIEAWNKTVTLKHYIESNEKQADKLMNNGEE